MVVVDKTGVVVVVVDKTVVVADKIVFVVDEDGVNVYLMKLFVV